MHNARPTHVVVATLLSFRYRRPCVASLCCRCAKIGRPWTPERSKIDSWTPENDPRRAQNRAKFAPRAPKSAPERPRVSPERPRAPQERPKSAPRASQERPRVPQERPKSAQEPPKSAPRAHLTALGNCFETSKVERSAFRKRSVARLAHEACREGFFIDFALVRASVGPHFDSPIPSRNEGRALVERFDSLERRITAEAPKSTLPSPQNRSKIDRERSSDDSERLQSRSWLDRGPLDALPESMLARSSGPEAILARSGRPKSARWFGLSRSRIG